MHRADGEAVRVPRPREDGSHYTLAGVFHVADASHRRIATLSHGLVSNKDTSLMTYVATHIGNCFRFDFTGCGESDGEFSYSGYKREVEDLRCVVQWLRADGWQVVCICGHSKAAAAVLTYAALHDDVPLVVNMAGRFDMSKQPSSRFTEEQMALLETQGWFRWERRGGIIIRREDIEERAQVDMTIVGNTHSAVFTVHGDADRVVPVADAYRWQEIIARHELCVVEGCDHSFTDDSHKRVLVERVAAFIDHHLQSL